MEGFEQKLIEKYFPCFKGKIVVHYSDFKNDRSTDGLLAKVSNGQQHIIVRRGANARMVIFHELLHLVVSVDYNFGKLGVNKKHLEQCPPEIQAFRKMFRNFFVDCEEATVELFTRANNKLYEGI